MLKHGFVFLVTALLIWFFYSGLMVHSYGHFRNNPNQYNYFKNLAVSISDGRLDIDCPQHNHDLVLYQGKCFLYWPPVPAVIYVPIVSIYGMETPDESIVSILGAINVMLVGFILSKLNVLLNLKLGLYHILLLVAFWGLGTVHFYMSMVGSVWFVSQIMAQTFLLSSILFFLRSSSIKDMAIAGLLFGLACYTRNDLVFTIFFFMGCGLAFFKIPSRIWLIKRGLAFLSFFLLFSSINMLYNYGRFGNLFENGIAHHQMADYFRRNYEEFGYFSFHYLPYNFYVEVIKPLALTIEYPFFRFDPEGVGLMWASPLFLLTLPTIFSYASEARRQCAPFRVSSISQELIFQTGLVLSTFFVALTIFFIMGTGWLQFASRYSLDYQLFLLLLLAFSFHRWKGKTWFEITALFLLILSIFIQYNGMRMFLKIGA